MTKAPVRLRPSGAYVMLASCYCLKQHRPLKIDCRCKQRKYSGINHLYSDIYNIGKSDPAADEVTDTGGC